MPKRGRNKECPKRSSDSSGAWDKMVWLSSESHPPKVDLLGSRKAALRWKDDTLKQLDPGALEWDGPARGATEVVVFLSGTG